MLVHMFNPATIVLGGRLARISDDLLAGVRAVRRISARIAACYAQAIGGEYVDRHACRDGRRDRARHRTRAVRRRDLGHCARK